MIKINRVSKAVQIPIEANGISIFRVIGTTDIDGKGTEHEIHDVDPFIFLDEAVINQVATTFSPHPHAGLAAVSHIFDGEIKAWDNLNGESSETNKAGGIYYINSGRGVVHSEISIKPTHWVQMWLNPGVYEYQANQAKAQLVNPNDIPVYIDEGIKARVLIGEVLGCESPVNCDWPVLYMRVELVANAKTELELDHENWNGFIYVVQGDGEFGSNSVNAKYQNLLLFDTNDSTVISVTNTSDSVLVFMLALGKPHNKGFKKLLGNGGAVVAETEEQARQMMAAYESDNESYSN